MSPAGVDDEREALVVVHHHPGRIRVRARVFRHASAIVDQVRAKLESQPGLKGITHNERSGSLLIEYEPGHAEPDTLLGRVAEAAGLGRAINESDARRGGPAPGLVALDVARELNEVAHELTGWRADLRVLVPAALAGLAAYSFATAKEPRLPRWDNLLYWSYNVFVNLHRHEIDSSTMSSTRSARTP